MDIRRFTSETQGVDFKNSYLKQSPYISYNKNITVSSFPLSNYLLVHTDYENFELPPGRELEFTEPGVFGLGKANAATILSNTSIIDRVNPESEVTASDLSGIPDIRFDIGIDFREVPDGQVGYSFKGNNRYISFSSFPADIPSITLGENLPVTQGHLRDDIDISLTDTIKTAEVLRTESGLGLRQPPDPDLLDLELFDILFYRGEGKQLFLDKISQDEGRQIFSSYPIDNRTSTGTPWEFNLLQKATSTGTYKGKLFEEMVQGGALKNLNLKGVTDLTGVYDLEIENITLQPGAVLVLNNCHRINMKNMEVFGDVGFFMVGMESCSDITIENCRFMNIPRNIGIQFSNCRSVNVRHCRFVGATTAINMIDCNYNDFTISNCQFIDCEKPVSENLEADILRAVMYNCFLNRVPQEHHITELSKNPSELAIALDPMNSLEGKVSDNFISIDNLGFSKGEQVEDKRVLRPGLSAEGENALFFEKNDYNIPNPFSDQNTAIWMNISLISRDIDTGEVNNLTDFVDWDNAIVRATADSNFLTNYYEWTFSGTPARTKDIWIDIRVEDANVVGSPSLATINSLRIEFPREFADQERKIIHCGGIFIQHAGVERIPMAYTNMDDEYNFYNNDKVIRQASNDLTGNFEENRSKLDANILNLWGSSTLYSHSADGDTAKVLYNDALLSYSLGTVVIGTETFREVNARFDPRTLLLLIDDGRIYKIPETHVIQSDKLFVDVSIIPDNYGEYDAWVFGRLLPTFGINNSFEEPPPNPRPNPRLLAGRTIYYEFKETGGTETVDFPDEEENGEVISLVDPDWTNDKFGFSGYNLDGLTYIKAKHLPNMSKWTDLPSSLVGGPADNINGFALFIIIELDNIPIITTTEETIMTKIPHNDINPQFLVPTEEHPDFTGPELPSTFGFTMINRVFLRAWTSVGILGSFPNGKYKKLFSDSDAISVFPGEITGIGMTTFDPGNGIFVVNDTVPVVNPTPIVPPKDWQEGVTDHSHVHFWAESPLNIGGWEGNLANGMHGKLYRALFTVEPVSIQELKEEIAKYL